MNLFLFNEDTRVSLTLATFMFPYGAILLLWLVESPHRSPPLKLAVITGLCAWERPPNPILSAARNIELHLASRSVDSK